MTSSCSTCTNDGRRCPVWMTLRRARAIRSANEFTEEHGGTNENKGPAGDRDATTGPLCSRLHRSGSGARSEADARNSQRPPRWREVSSPAREAPRRFDPRGRRSPALARREAGTRGETRSQARDVRSAWSGRGRRCGGSRKASPSLRLVTVWGQREQRRVRRSGGGRPARLSLADGLLGAAHFQRVTRRRVSCGPQASTDRENLFLLRKGCPFP